MRKFLQKTIRIVVLCMVFFSPEIHASQSKCGLFDTKLMRSLRLGFETAKKEYNRKTLFPLIEPYYKTDSYDVGDGHKIYYELSGNKNGKPALFLHGGPGAISPPKYRGLWNPENYRIILFDQRGAGRSTPHASTENNTTWNLVADMEKLREHLGINKWQLYGGSWGSTLALAYAIKYPERVSELILRGVYLLRQSEIDWFYQAGADQIFPDLWEAYRDHIPSEERDNFREAYHKRLTSDDRDIQVAAALPWTFWEGSTAQLLINPSAQFSDPNFALAFARIENHYFMNKGFLEEDYLLRNVHRIKDIPTVIIHGRYDIVCPIKNAWDLFQAMTAGEEPSPEKIHTIQSGDIRYIGKNTTLIIVPDAGHAVSEPGITHEIISATERFKERGISR